MVKVWTARIFAAFLIPIAASGGTAKEIANDLLGSTLPSDGEPAVRPTDEELRMLASPNADVNELIAITRSIIERVSNSS